ncbi:alpha/beta hydrolase fold domain-containing protein [Pseudonocardia acaciae]|uniref:alpha/beta hydrolase fold domain-containing protein n=1 Tax=Pseudonocardia acaciae TaxID=551276 RepID=UPI0004905481|nr:alpha/beta hydrolase fold domain-containing protein [Pseudonocardia acaciae]
MALDPQVRRVIDTLRADGLTMAPAQVADDDVMATVMALQGDPEPVDDVWRLTVPGPETGLPARAYRPIGDGPDPLPVLVYLHGGELGYGLGYGGGGGDDGLDLADRPCRALANATGAVVASVRCRSGPDSPFPAAVRDGAAATDWFAEHAAALGGDPARIGVAGHGAGATVAAVVAQQARRDGPVLAWQLLLCPVLDFAGRWPSRIEHADGYLLTATDLDLFGARYLTGAEDVTDPRVSPLRADDLTGLPPTALVTAGFDPLRDEGLAYAAALAGAGVEVLDCRNETMAHGFCWMTGAVAHARTVLDRIGAHAREVFAAALNP